VLFVRTNVRSVAGFEFPGGESEAEKVQQLYRRLFGRAAERGSSSRLGVYCCAEARRGTTDPHLARRPPVDESLTAWEKYAQVLLATNEFAFVD
jgi:hypothetical protein